MNLVQDPISKLVLPRKFIDEKQALKKVIDDVLEIIVNDNQHIRENYFLTLHAKFSKHNSKEFKINKPIITFKLPPFISNSFVFWISNTKGICELLWMTSKRNKKLAVEFNKSGVAYLHAKGAMPS